MNSLQIFYYLELENPAIATSGGESLESFSILHAKCMYIMKSKQYD